jgi:hemerythrin-like domain-containing protein
VKRAEALRPLSREHLRTLVVAKELKEAADPQEAAAAFLDFWREDGSAHLRIEEEVLLPFWAAHADMDSEAFLRVVQEHLVIRREALRLETGDATDSEIRALGQTLHDHVRFEERRLFPMIEEDLHAGAIEVLAAALRA